MIKPIRILLADDHNMVRSGICSLLKSTDGVEVVAETDNGRDALGLIKALRPDVALVDITMPGLNGLDLAARVTEESLRVRVIILSMHISEEYVLQALRNGAAGYLAKEASSAELQIAIKAVVRGEVYLSPGVSKHIVKDYIQLVSDKTNPFESLTPRQREILQLIAEGHSTKSIASMLNISAKTVITHRLQLMERLGVYDIAGLVRYAIRLGLVKSD